MRAVLDQSLTIGPSARVCPTCGTCPTCGHRDAPMVSPWAVPPNMPYVQPQPYYPPVYPAPNNPSITITFTCETAESNVAA